MEQRQRIGLGSLTRREFTCALALGVGSAAPRFASTTPQPLQPSSINIGGDLGRRAALSFNRLESDIYSPPQVFNSRSIKSWPGDWEGRTILGLTLLEQYTKRPARHLPQILREMRNHLNTGGYFGPLSSGGIIDEQQLSGHGWVLRGLAERYEQTKSDEIADSLSRVLRNLALPTLGKHRNYPIDPAQRKDAGEAAGSILGRIGDWNVSTDVGCDFIFLDGVRMPRSHRD